MTVLLEVDGVSVRFGGVHALRDVTLRVEEGAVVGLIGPNGAGKTTLFNVVSGLQRPANGVVRFAGTDVTRFPVEARARLGIGRAFQNLGLMFDEPVRTNLLAAQHLAIGYRAADPLLRPWRWRRDEARLERRARRALATFGLEDRLDDQVAGLSFAAARFVELAAVLVEEPRLMLLDEPTTGLDVDETARLLDVLRRVRDTGTTVLLVAHDVRFVMTLCQQVYVLAEGEVIAQGEPAVVQQDPAVVEAYLGSTA